MNPTKPAKASIYHRLRRINQRMVANYRHGTGPRGLVLLLTTTGRKSGQPRVTPLQFEVVDGVVYTASARGQQADWFRNILANPRVCVQIRDHQFEAVAEPVTDPNRIADFLELRRQRHPLMIRLIMLLEGVSPWANRASLESFAREKALIAILPCEPELFSKNKG
ncbi:MAG TPA: nitroreductase family deazaflavin-dependent oxidoreductase [Anaerolineales bacterium]|jgi:deazaflavin-dependent oxidoreductase (nitroreductase family)|nr:nitroreductase family deazaflavin-dependent oxidoreductase [Anaerolineales bacterium]